MSSFPGRVAVVAVVLFFLNISSTAWSHPTEYHHHHPWESFRNFSGCHLGDHRAGLAHVKRYLHRFGYLPGSPGNFSDDFDRELESALVAYQHNFHLNETGALDASTIALVTSPRCGVADAINATASSGKLIARDRKLYSYFPGTPRWPPSKRHLTYAFPPSARVSPRVRALFARAFARWSAVTTFSFSEVAQSGSDITIGFLRGNHGDSASPFDGAGGVLAHAYAPTDGRLHVDADEVWVVEGDVTQSSSPNAFDLESVVVHEIGHILGLRHSTVEGAIMYPSIPPRTRKVELANDDILGIQGLYGTN